MNDEKSLEAQKEITDAVLRSLNIWMKQDRYGLGPMQTSIECAVACLDCWAIILKEVFQLDGEDLYAITREALIRASKLTEGRLTVVE